MDSKIILLLATLYLPFVSFVGSHTEPPPPTPVPMDPAIVRYASNVQGVWTNYNLIAIELTNFSSKIARDPLFVRDDAFSSSIYSLTVQIRLVRQQLDDVPSPEPVEEIHEELETASDLFNLSADRLDRFAMSHDLDDFADAFELMAGGTAIWTRMLQELTALSNPSAPEGTAP